MSQRNIILTANFEIDLWCLDNLIEHLSNAHWDSTFGIFHRKPVISLLKDGAIYLRQNLALILDEYKKENP
jgi:hypothetical protein